MLIVILLGFGTLSLTKLKSTFFPIAPSRFIQIQVVYPGASPQEIEEGVVLKIEENLKSVPGIERIVSESRENIASIEIEVLKAFSVDEVLIDVQNAVDRINSFPSGIEPPVVFKRQNIEEAISFAVTGDVDLKTLKNYAQGIEDDLRSYMEISQISITGYPDEEIEVQLKENVLSAFGITFDEVANSLRAANIEVTGGIIRNENEEILIRTDEKRYFAKELENIVVRANPDGKVVLLKDIATILDRWSDVPNRSYFNGKPSAVITVSKMDDEDILKISEIVNEYIVSFNEANEIVKAEVIIDRTDFLRQRINLLLNNGFTGTILVVLILAFFINSRLAFWVAVGIPVSVFGMFIIANAMGLTINVISIFGIILIVGIVVDDGIVIAESVFQEMEKGKPRMQAAVDGTLAVLPSVFTAIITTCTVFLAFFFVEGRLGDIIKDMGTVVIITLLISLVEAVFVLPAHLAGMKVNKQNELSKFRKFTEGIMNYLRDKIYTPTYDFTIQYKWPVLSVFIGLMMITIGASKGGIIKFTPFPYIPPDNIEVNLKMPAGTREKITEKWLTHIENAALELNEELKYEHNDGNNIILNIQKNIGPANEGKIKIQLPQGDLKNLEAFQLSNMLRDKAGVIPEAEQITYGFVSRFGKPVSVSLLSKNLQDLEMAKIMLKEELSQMSSLRDITDNQDIGLKEIKIHLKEKAKLLGLTHFEITRQIRNGFFGLEVQRLQRGVDEVKVWVRYAPEDRVSSFQLEEMNIRIPSGEMYPLKELVDFELTRGVVAINHLDTKREVRVEADLANPNDPLPPIIEEVENVILPKVLARFPSISIDYGGQTREDKKTFSSLRSIGLLVLLLMLSIIVLSFRSVPQTLLVLPLIILSFIGVGWGHYLIGFPISRLSIFGFVGLVGIIVNDTLVFINTFNSSLKQGTKFDIALRETAISRFRPILLTSITTIGGLAPLIWEKSLQAQFLKPMAISISFGLFVTLFTTLILLPLLLIGLNWLRRKLTWAFTGENPTKEEVEPAVKELRPID